MFKIKNKIDWYYTIDLLFFKYFTKECFSILKFIILIKLSHMLVKVLEVLFFRSYYYYSRVNIDKELGII
jgi:hypothetical protein